MSSVPFADRGLDWHPSVADKNSLGNALVAHVFHIRWDVGVSFATQRLNGVATLFLRRNVKANPSGAISTIDLDAKALEVVSLEGKPVVRSAVLKDSVANVRAGKWTKERLEKEISWGDVASVGPILAADHAHYTAFGEGLRIQLAAPFNEGATEDEVLAISIAYQTSSDPNKALALCWLNAEQTKDKQAPFMYSQCQAIHARTMLPVQDSPGVRVTYEAAVTPQGATGVKALMSALPDEANTNESMNVFAFRQPIAIAPYLIALVCGSLGQKDISDRCRVYAEPSFVEACGWEFAEMETFLQVAEKLAGPYQWSRYDLVVLPPSFPYGGMENPNLTFVTPSLITGDRSLVEVVAHEICHSWSGNLVGCATWEDFFLNEGFTVLLQRKMTRDMVNQAMADFEGLTGWSHLQQSVDAFKNELPYTQMIPDLTGIDPDDSFSSVPYEKGCTFLQCLEGVVGPEAFDAWLPTYFESFQHQSITAKEMREHFLNHFADKKADIEKAVDFNRFYTEQGMPSFKPKFDASAREECDQLAKKFLAFDGGNAEALASFEYPTKWGGQQHVGFLECVRDALAPDSGLKAETLRALDERFGYQTKVVNFEVLCLWYLICLRTLPLVKDGEAAPSIEGVDFVPKMIDLLSNIGRMKFVRPLFAAWGQRDLKSAQATFAKLESGYHSIAKKMLVKDLHLA